MATATEERVHELLSDISGLQDVRELLAELNYDYTDAPISTRDWGKTATQGLADDPRIVSEHGDFQVIYCRLVRDRLLRTPERAAVNKLLRAHLHALFVFSDCDQSEWHFLNVKYDKDPERRRLFRRITVGRDERLHTAARRIAMLDVADIGDPAAGVPPLELQERHDEAFDVEAVTQEFFEDYKEVFWDLQDDLADQTGDERWAHDYAQQFLNRLMFIYFIQRKRWLGDDPQFLAHFWQAYRKAGGHEDGFVEGWLKVLFFEAFNNRKNLLNSPQRAYLPDDILHALREAPYLNGGLFNENKRDHLARNRDVVITDERFGQIFGFLERYNFTIAEDSPIDKEVAVDPEMIGKVYESLVNVSAEADERGDAGIFYTPRTEIDLMCRLTLVDNLKNHLGEEHRDRLYEAVFAMEPDEKTEADASLAEADLWADVEERLKDLSVVDPACGSGSFLVGMLYIVDDLLERAARAQGREPESAYERRKRIIGRSLYGVDVMEWACHVAELRLWLALVVDAEFTRQELMVRREALLPHFTFNIRCGDSIVQEVGGVNLQHRAGSAEIPRAIKARLTRLQKAKRAFYNNDPLRQFDTETKIKGEELAVFRDLLDHRVRALEKQAKDLMILQKQQEVSQTTLDGGKKPRDKNLEAKRREREKKIERLMEEKKSVEAARAELKQEPDLPFVWDIAFAEIMESEASGFDIVVGNPPYVRQENIAPPGKPRYEATRAEKSAYKKRLERAVYQAWPAFFQYSAARDDGGDPRDASGRNLSRRCDLYIYFYFFCLSLVGRRGAFCFITSNSWLDVEYGADLQEFLLKHCHVQLVIDNEVQRSFVSADVNTVIVVLHPLHGAEWKGLEQTARFVMVRRPFEQLMCPAVAFEEIEGALTRGSNPDYRVHPVSQCELLQEGWEWPREAVDEQRRAFKFTIGSYDMNKWGALYHRAPEVLWELLSEPQTLCKFSQLTKRIQRNNMQNLRTTAYVARSECPDGYPFLHSVKDVRSIHVEPDQLPKVIPRTGQEDVEWLIPDVISNRFIGNRLCFFEGGDFLVNDSFFVATLKPAFDREIILALLNSAVSLLFLEQMGRKNMGEGVLCVYGTELAAHRLPSPTVFSEDQLHALCRQYRVLGRRVLQPVDEELGMRDRQKLDELVFDAMGLTPSNGDRVYNALCSLVESRVDKATSV